MISRILLALGFAFIVGSQQGCKTADQNTQQSTSGLAASRIEQKAYQYFCSPYLPVSSTKVFGKGFQVEFKANDSGVYISGDTMQFRKNQTSQVVKIEGDRGVFDSTFHTPAQGGSGSYIGFHQLISSHGEMRLFLSYGMESGADTASASWAGKYDDERAGYDRYTCTRR